MTFIGGPAARCIAAGEWGGLMPLLAVAARLGVDRRELYRIRKTGTFPKPVELGYGYTRAVVFRAQAIDDWCRANRR